jgi:hypothetical protein
MPTTTYPGEAFRAQKDIGMLSGERWTKVATNQNDEPRQSTVAL